MNKLIQLEHEVADYCCMWKGIEDMYQTRTGEKVPGFLFFLLSGQGEFAYLTTNQAESKRMTVWGEGRPKKTYKRVNDIIGFDYKHMENTRFSYMLNAAIAQIDSNHPVILGPLDMYYLSYYPKIYHHHHIPCHYVMMVGYDKEKKCVFISDCGVKEVQSISYDVLELAMAEGMPGVGGKNGMCTVQFKDRLPSLHDIVMQCFKQKCTQMLQSKVCFSGIRGMNKLAAEIDTWSESFSKDEYDKVIKNFVLGTGTVPCLPERLFGAPKDAIAHHGCRDVYAKLLIQLSDRYGIEEWKKAAQYFKQSGELIQKVTDAMVEYLLKKTKQVGKQEETIKSIVKLEEQANQLILDGIK